MYLLQVSILLPLIKERKLVIPGYSQPLQAASHFKLFLTQRLILLVSFD